MSSLFGSCDDLFGSCTIVERWKSRRPVPCELRPPSARSHPGMWYACDIKPANRFGMVLVGRPCGTGADEGQYIIPGKL